MRTFSPQSFHVITTDGHTRAPKDALCVLLPDKSKRQALAPTGIFEIQYVGPLNTAKVKGRKSFSSFSAEVR